MVLNRTRFLTLIMEIREGLVYLYPSTTYRSFFLPVSSSIHLSAYTKVETGLVRFSAWKQ